MEAMAVEALISAVDGKMGDGTGFAKGIEIKVGLFCGDLPNVAERR